jgi:hypothetical protein
MKATVAPWAGGTAVARASRLALFPAAAFDRASLSDIVLQSSYTHSPLAGSEGVFDAGRT